MKQQENVNAKGSGSQGIWSGRTRPRLPSPVPLYVSPLKKAISPVRRPKKFWTPEEMEALREGVKEYATLFAKSHTLLSLSNADTSSLKSLNLAHVICL